MKNIHSGHRQRLKQRFLEEGLASFNEHQVLELLLYYSLPQGDTNELAHGLIESYGSLSAVLEANYEDLRQHKGLGAHSALLLTMLPHLMRYYQLARGKPKNVLRDRRDLVEYAKRLFIGEAQELVYLICLDARNNVIQAIKINAGALDNVSIELRAVAEAALRCKAKSVVLTHNHPAGSLKPSVADIALTKQLAALLGALAIAMLDHIIVANDKYVSFVEKGLLL
jgi:DNA repair protein RadC